METFSALLAEQLNLPRIVPHVSTLFSSFLAFCMVHVSAPILSESIIPAYSRLGPRMQQRWDVHLVSMLHSLLIVPLAWMCLELPELAADRAFGWDHKVGQLHAIACGYFLWDVVESSLSLLLHGDISPAFLFHALGCLSVFGFSYRPFLAYYGPRFLLWEISTPFVHLNWFLEHSSLRTSFLRDINTYVLSFLYFGARIVYGGLMSLDFTKTVWSVRDQVPLSIILVYGVGNVLLQGLNWIWFLKTLRKARRGPADVRINQK